MAAGANAAAGRRETSETPLPPETGTLPPTAGLRAARWMAAGALAVFVAGNLRFCDSVSRGQEPPALRLFVLGAFLLAAATVALLEIASRHRERLANLWQKATRDPLTGCLNRGAILDAGAAALERARELGTSVAFLLVDVDRFKQVNDNHGHEAGDEILRDTARRLRTGIDAGAEVGRLGGDEFLVILEDCPWPRLRGIAQAPPGAIQPSVQAGRSLVATTLSLGGVTVAGNGPWAGAKTLLAAADEMLYEAKRSGRARWSVRELGSERCWPCRSGQSLLSEADTTGGSRPGGEAGTSKPREDQALAGNLG